MKFRIIHLIGDYLVWSSILFNSWSQVNGVPCYAFSWTLQNKNLHIKYFGADYKVRKSALFIPSRNVRFYFLSVYLNIFFAAVLLNTLVVLFSRWEAWMPILRRMNCFNSGSYPVLRNRSMF